MAASLALKRGARRVFMCTECHKAFRTREELYMHAELCLLEAFEVEASHMLADMPNLEKGQDDVNDAGGSSTTQQLKPYAAEDFSPQVGERPPDLRPEKPTPDQNIERHRVPHREEDDGKEIRKPMSYTSNRPTTVLTSESRTIQSGSGLKLVVSVERPEESASRNVECSSDMLEDEDDEEEEDEYEDLDEDVSVPPSPRRLPQVSRSGIIGALANADEDMYKPKMECPTCGLVLYRHNFSTHYRIHTGEMPFQCSYCDKRFRTTSALKVHVRAHTGEKPYVCPRCNYACITKRNLDRHIINNHVREGVRRGPRYRRSRYRLHDPQYEEYMVDMARKQAEQTGVHMDEEESQFLLNEETNGVETLEHDVTGGVSCQEGIVQLHGHIPSEEIVDEPEETVQDHSLQRSSRQNTKRVVVNEQGQESLVGEENEQKL